MERKPMDISNLNEEQLISLRNSINERLSYLSNPFNYNYAKNELKVLKDKGHEFDYELTKGDYINYLTIAIEKRGYSLEKMISLLKPKEKIFFSVNMGLNFNGSVYQKKGSIYWNHSSCGLCVRIKASEDSIKNWFDEKL